LKDLRALAARLPALLEQPVRSEGVSAGRQQRRLSPDERAALLIEYQAGALVRDLAREWGIGRSTISEILRTSGVRRPTGLSVDQVLEAQHLYEVERWSLQRIGERFSVAHTTVRRALLTAGLQMRDSHGRPG
jgi:transposase-like protein